MTSTRRPRRLPLALLSLMLTAAMGCDFDIDCNFSGDWGWDWGWDWGDWSHGMGEGCGGTPGNLDEVRFLFQQDPVRDHSAHGGVRFALGTTQRYTVYTRDEVLIRKEPRIEGDALERLDPVDGRFPWGFLAAHEGTAKLLLDSGGEDTAQDWLGVQVQVAHSLSVSCGPLLDDPGDLTFVPERPERIYLAPGARARLYADLRGEEGELLYGLYRPVVRDATSISAHVEGMVSLHIPGFTSQASIVISAQPSADGSELLTLTGPNNATGQLEVYTPAQPPQVTGLEAHVTPGRRIGPPGLMARLTVWGRVDSETPAYGYPIQFRVVDSDALRLAPDPTRADSVMVHFVSPGEHQVEATWHGAPSIHLVITFHVTEPSVPSPS